MHRLVEFSCSWFLLVCLYLSGVLFFNFFFTYIRAIKISCYDPSSFVKTSPHTINNANTFLTNIKDLKLEPDEIMISFDVVSLFTSIPLDTEKRITNELLTYDESWQTRTKLDKHDILELLDLCLSTEFSFQNSY